MKIHVDIEKSDENAFEKASKMVVNTELNKNRKPSFYIKLGFGELPLWRDSSNSMVKWQQGIVRIQTTIIDN